MIHDKDERYAVEYQPAPQPSTVAPGEARLIALAAELANENERLRGVLRSLLNEKGSVQYPPEHERVVAARKALEAPALPLSDITNEMRQAAWTRFTSADVPYSAIYAVMHRALPSTAPATGETPRTDKDFDTVEIVLGDDDRSLVPAERYEALLTHARQLERDLADTNRRFAEHRKLNAALSALPSATKSTERAAVLKEAAQVARSMVWQKDRFHEGTSRHIADVLEAMARLSEAANEASPPETKSTGEPK